MKSMSALLRFSVLFAGMVGLHNAEEMGLHEACKTETRFQSGEEMGLFLPLGSYAIFLSTRHHAWAQKRIVSIVFF
jgi:hypothetical protein